MWKLKLTLKNKRINRAFDKFTGDFFTWVLDQDRNKSLNELESLACQTHDSLGRLAKENPKLRKHMALCAKSTQKMDFVALYESGINNYESIFRGLKSITLDNLIPKNKRILKETFRYFYSELVDNISFRNEYLNFLKQESKKEYRRIFTLKRKACPYCDYQQITSDRSTMDHFLPQDRYPFLSIFSRNLIVSCSDCNEHIKGDKILYPIFHPGFDQIHNKFSFLFDIQLNSFSIKEKSIVDSVSVKNYYKLFKLEILYKNQLEILKKERTEIEEEVYKKYKLIRKIAPNKSENTIIRQLFGKLVLKRLCQKRSLAGEMPLTKFWQDFYQFMLNNIEFEVEYIRWCYGVN